MREILIIHEYTGMNLLLRAHMCVFVCACMPEYVFADDGLLIRLCKRLILFRIESCFNLRAFCPLLKVYNFVY